MKFLNAIHYFDTPRNTQVIDKSGHTQADEAQEEAYGVGAAMPADVSDFVFAADNRSSIHAA